MQVRKRKDNVSNVNTHATGVPHAMASIITLPKVSVLEVKTKTSAAAKYIANSRPSFCPAKMTESPYVFSNCPF